MAILKTFVASLLVSLVLFQAFQLDAASVDTYPPTKIGHSENPKSQTQKLSSDPKISSSSIAIESNQFLWRN
uniref:Uncharacterized protein n=1 Tax=Helianthus annuus TaxID=4232 RepID=A0A251TM92_HELAN